MKKLLKKITENPKLDIFSGITVSLAMIPEVVAFAFVAAIDPLVALSGAFIVGLVAAVFGGRPGLISGAAGAVAVIFVSLIQKGNEMGLSFDTPVENMGYYYLLAAVILMGLIQILAGLFKIGKFVRLIPHPVMMGFVNGLAVVIFLAQLKMFMHRNLEIGANGVSEYVSVMMSGKELYTMIALVLFTMALVYLIPKITKKIPAALTAILATTILVLVTKMDVASVGSYIVEGGGAGLSGSFPTPNLELWKHLPLTLSTFTFILPYAFLAASVGLIESLMTMNLVDEMTHSHGDGNKECLGQGFANTLSGLFGGTGGCGMIGQTVININSGGRGRLSGIVMALSLLMFVLFAGPYIEQVPTAALVAVMFVMVIDTFAWSSFRIMKKIPKSDAFVLIAVSLITIFFDLAIAVFVGVIISALVFAWESSKHIHVESTESDGQKKYTVHGPLFFATVQEFASYFDPSNDPDSVEINFSDSRVSDHSALESLLVLANKYEKHGKNLKFSYLSDDCKILMQRKSEKLEKNILDSESDPEYYVMA